MINYNKKERTPINVLEIQLVGAERTFDQDVQLRAFVKDSLKEGVIVEVYDYKKGTLEIHPYDQR